MGIVKIYNVLGGFYSYYSITLASESVNKYAQIFDYFLCSFTILFHATQFAVFHLENFITNFHVFRIMACH